MTFHSSDEQWRAISYPGLIAGYEISTAGRIRRIMPDGSVVHQALRRKEPLDDKLFAFLRTEAGATVKLVPGRLVLSTFGDPAPFPHCKIQYLNGDIHDHRIENLRWSSGVSRVRVTMPSNPKDHWGAYKKGSLIARIPPIRIHSEAFHEKAENDLEVILNITFPPYMIDRRDNGSLVLMRCYGSGFEEKYDLRPLDPQDV